MSYASDAIVSEQTESEKITNNTKQRNNSTVSAIINVSVSI